MSTWDENEIVLGDLFKKLAAYDDAKIETLTAEPEAASEDKEGFEFSRQLKKEKARKAKQENDLRGSFFGWGLTMVTLVLVCTSGVAIWHMIATNGNPSDTFLIGWMSTAIVETIGLGYIIANYLFDGRAKNGSKAWKRSDRS